MIADLEETDGARHRSSSRARRSASPRTPNRELRACFEGEEPFRVADLPGELDADGRLVLVRRLVREGFLSVVDTP